MIRDRLRLARELADVSKSELSMLAGLSRNHVDSIEAGHSKNPETRTVEALATVLGCPFEWLAIGKGDAPTAEVVRAAVDLARARRTERESGPLPTDAAAEATGTHQ